MCCILNWYQSNYPSTLLPHLSRDQCLLGPLTARLKASLRIPRGTPLREDNQAHLILEIWSHSSLILQQNQTWLFREASHFRIQSQKKFQVKRTSFLSNYQAQLKMIVISNCSNLQRQSVKAHLDHIRVLSLLWTYATQLDQLTNTLSKCQPLRINAPQQQTSWKLSHKAPCFTKASNRTGNFRVLTLVLLR